MKHEEQKNNGEKPQITSSNLVKRSFSQTLNEVEARIEWECFGHNKRAKARELCMIIAEVERLPPDSLIRIDGEDREASEITEIYRMLTHDHIEQVLENIGLVQYRIRAMKTYLRTALYNSVFTIENSLENSVQCDI